MYVQFEMVVGEGVNLAVVEIMDGGKSGGVYVVLFSEFEEGEGVFVAVDPGINSAHWWRILIFFTGLLFCHLYWISFVVLLECVKDDILWIFGPRCTRIGK